MAIDKPFGLPTQRGPRDTDSVLDRVSAQFGAAFPVHRLDQVASGLVIVAVTREAARRWSELLQVGRLHRGYEAVVMGETTTCIWDKFVDGKAARTRVVASPSRAGMTHVSVSLETGRFHQIRQHAALAGTPIVGDRRYGMEIGRRWPRLALHAATLILDDATDPLALTSPIPADLAALWCSAGHPPTG